MSRTIQDLKREGLLHSGRYFGVVEWQNETAQAHFHFLLDASFIPHDRLLASWSKHRPEWAGPVEGKRPAFGTVFISKRKFAGSPRHASNYTTKYLTKMPAHGFPEWVMGMGKERRVRRYTTSRGFWGREYPPRREPESKRDVSPVTYARRVASCGDTTNLIIDQDEYSRVTGEFRTRYAWVCEMDIDAATIADLPLMGCEASRGLLGARSSTDALKELARNLDRKVTVIRSGVLLGGRIEDHDEE